MKRQHDPGRAERVRMVLADLRVRKVKGVLPASRFDDIARENAELALRRPDPARNHVTLNEQGLALFERNMRMSQEIFGDKYPQFPSLVDLYNAFRASLVYVTFDEILRRIHAGVHEVLCHPIVQDANTLLLLVIPEHAISKSTMWFSVEAWLAADTSGLAERVDILLTTATRANSVANVGRDHGFTATAAIYMDDVVYSGMQLSEVVGELTDDIHIFPIVAALTKKGRERANNAGGTVYWMQSSRVIDRSLRDVLRSNGITVDSELEPSDWNTLDDDREDDPSPVLLYAQFLHMGELPTIVCEHKLADAVTVNSNLLLGSYVWVNKNHIMPNPHPLVLVGGRDPVHAHSGSGAFYKTLKWRVHGEQQHSMPMQAALAAYHSAPLMCVACGTERAHSRCAGCSLAYYCSVACQSEHWQHQHALACKK